jgi:hypothetical protein
MENAYEVDEVALIVFFALTRNVAMFMSTCTSRSRSAAAAHAEPEEAAAAPVSLATTVSSEMSASTAEDLIAVDAWSSAWGQAEAEKLSASAGAFLKLSVVSAAHDVFGRAIRLVDENLVIDRHRSCSEMKHPEVSTCYFFPYAKTACHMLALHSARQLDRLFERASFAIGRKCNEGSRRYASHGGHVRCTDLLCDGRGYGERGRWEFAHLELRDAQWDSDPEMRDHQPSDADRPAWQSGERFCSASFPRKHDGSRSRALSDPLGWEFEEPRVVPLESAAMSFRADAGHFIAAWATLAVFPLRDRPLRDLGYCGELGLREPENAFSDVPER